MRGADAESLWRSGPRGWQLLEKHRVLLDRIGAEKRAWEAELAGLELNEQQQRALTERILDEERRRHGASCVVRGARARVRYGVCVRVIVVCVYVWRRVACCVLRGAACLWRVAPPNGSCTRVLQQ